MFSHQEVRKTKTTKEVVRKIRANTVLVLVLIILLALGVRLGITYNTRGVYYYAGMTISFGEVARNLVEGRGFVSGGEYARRVWKLQEEKRMLVDFQDVPAPKDDSFAPFYALPPGPSVLLAGTYWAFGEYRYIYLRVIQALIDSFGCLLMFLIGRELFNRRIGLIAAFLYALYLPIASLSTLVLHDALVPFIALLSLYFFIRAVRRGSIKLYILSALFVGIGGYFQPTILLLPLMFGVALFIYNLRKLNLREQVANMVKITAIMMAVVVLVISPWIARNYRITGAVMIMRSSLWQGIWEGFGEFENPVGAVFSDEITYAQVREEVGYDIKYGTPEYDAVLKEKSLRAIKEHPGWWLSILARRVPRALVYFSDIGIGYYPRDEVGNIVLNESVVLETLPWLREALKSGIFWEFVKSRIYATFYSGLVLPGLVLLFSFVPVLLSLAGIWLMRRKWRMLVLVATIPIYFSAVHMLVFVSQSKSLLPGSLAYIIFSATALYWMYSAIKGIRSKTDQLAIPVGS